MGNKAICEEGRELLTDASCGRRPQTAEEESGCRTRVSACAGHVGPSQTAPAPGRATPRPSASAQRSPSWEEHASQEVEHQAGGDGLRRASQPATPEAISSPGRKTVHIEEEEGDSFHDSESQDIFDLFNAVNGVVLENGLLDASKLNEYGPADAEALNVPRLWEIYDHATGCDQCKQIIRALYDLRRTLKRGPRGGSDERPETGGAKGAGRAS